MSSENKKECPGCHGAKGLNIVVGIDRKSKARKTKWENCKTCNGKGTI